jgi:high-affinity iron transporter
MLAAFMVMLRETLEAALIIGIISSFLVRTDQRRYLMQVVGGGAAGIAASLLAAFLFNRFSNGFSGRTEALFEGITMIAGALLITTMILWMLNQYNIKRDIERQVSKRVAGTFGAGVFFLTFISILREGVESVIFLAAIHFTTTENTLLGALLGMATAIVLGYFLFLGSLKLNIKKVFAFTSILLILFAAGLAAHGVHELQEAGFIPVFIEHVWDINPAVEQVGMYPLLHENGYIGSILKGLFGYNGNPSLLEVTVYASYIMAVIFIWGVKTRSRRPGYSRGTALRGNKGTAETNP